MVGNRINVRLLGPFEAARDGEFSDRIRFSTKKVGALLAFLVLSPQQAATREQLGALLWGNSPDAQARQSLRQALLMLRKDLAPADAIDAGVQVVRLRPGAVVVDALQLEALSTSDDPADIERAAALAAGEFMAGFGLEEELFEEWLRQQRRRFDGACTAVLEAHARECDRTGRGSQAIAAAERLLALDPLREDWQRLALLIYARHRGHNEALAQAKEFEDVLRRELDVEPEDETRDLVQQIRRGEVARVVVDPVVAPPPVAPAASRVKPAPSHSPPLENPARANARQNAPRAWSLPASVWSLLTPRAGVALAMIALVPAALLALSKTPLLTRAVPSLAPIAASGPAAATPAKPTVSPRRSLALEKGAVAIVVLPFTGNGNDTDAPNALADLISDELTTVLSSIKTMRVISRETARTLRGQDIHATAIGAEFGVHYLLEGSVSLRDNRLRVSVGLVDATTGLRVWSHRFERGGGDRLAIQDEIVNSLGRHLQVEIARIEGERPTTDPDLHALISQGWVKLYAAGRQGKEAFQSAEKLFVEALERDPSNAYAQLGLGAYHVNMAVQLFASDPDPHLARGEAILTELIQRRPDMATANFFMGLARVARNQLPEAKAWFERAIELSPSHASSYAQLGRALVRLGDPERGLEHVLYAIRLSPRDPGLAIWLAFAGYAQLELKRFNEALVNLERALTLYPGQPRTVLCAVATLALLGDLDEARRRLEQLRADLPHLTREALMKRFGGNRANSQYGRGLRLALGLPGEGTTAEMPSSGQPEPTEREGLRHLGRRNSLAPGLFRAE